MKLKQVLFLKKKIPMSNPVIFKSLIEFQTYRSGLLGSVGFVPTMGALHEGHASLLKKSAAENDHTILSIFVNPTQFNDPKDLEKYPRTLDSDLAWAKNSNVTAIIYPDFDQMYPDQYRYQVTENKFSKILCGQSRPGHFDGVLTVVMKLLNIVNADHAYFGEKDYQQLTLIKDMAASFFMKTKIIGLPTQREASGLAMSSRNTRLSEDGKTKAAQIYSIIKQSIPTEHARNLLKEAGFKIDYLEDIENRRYVAAFLEGVRLIDNVELK
jgi:pantoate--beta-alanine ligase